MTVPTREDRLRYRTLCQALETRSARRTQQGEGGIGRSTDREVIRVAEDPVGPEGDDDGGVLFIEDGRDRRDQFVERYLCHPSVRQTEPLMAVGNPSERSPRGLVIAAPNRTEGLARGREPVADVAELAVSCVDQNEAEVRVLGVEGDAAGRCVGVVIRMREHAGEGAVAGHASNVATDLPRPLPAQRTSAHRHECTDRNA